jgi:riboflavin synthase
MVFSGIVETTGIVRLVKEHGQSKMAGVTLLIEPKSKSFIGSDISIGCSIAVNGTCLTVTEFNESSFMVDLAPETLAKTSFSYVDVNDEVNLERALKMNDRNSGHTVQGHVDGVGVIESMKQDGVSVRVRISVRSLSADASVRKYMKSLIVPKGFIAVDGASLTVCEVNHVEEWFTLMLIPHTLEVLKPWREGQRLNLELDVLAKYVSSTVSNMVAPIIESTTSRIHRLEMISGLAIAMSAICGVMILKRS